MWHGRAMGVGCGARTRHGHGRGVGHQRVMGMRGGGMDMARSWAWRTSWAQGMNVARAWHEHEHGMGMDTDMAWMWHGHERGLGMGTAWAWEHRGQRAWARHGHGVPTQHMHEDHQHAKDTGGRDLPRAWDMLALPTCGRGTSPTWDGSVTGRAPVGGGATWVQRGTPVPLCPQCCWVSQYPGAAGCLGAEGSA